MHNFFTKAKSKKNLSEKNNQIEGIELLIAELFIPTQ